MKWKPHKYQMTAMKWLLEHACAALFLDPGLGKTSSTLGAIQFLKKRDLIGKVLVIAPLRVCYSVWPVEVKKWEEFHDLKVVVLHGPDKDAQLARDADIYVINPEGLDWLLAPTKEKFDKTYIDRKTGAAKQTKRTKVSVDVRRFKKLGFDLLVIDELSKFKHTNTNRFKMLKEVIHTFGRRWGLTGSPASNGLIDLFGQCYMLDEGACLGRFVTSYKDTYFYPDRNGFDWHLKEGAADMIYKKIAPLALRMGNELLDMPELVKNPIMVSLPPKARMLYDQLEADLIIGLDKGLVTAKTAATLSGKCRQAANGAIWLDPQILESGLRSVDKREWGIVHDAKVEALADLVDELQGSPLLVGYEFIHDYQRLKLAFPKAEFAADYTAKTWPAVVERWNKGEIPLLFGHPASVGHGNNMQDVGHHVAWFGPTWDLELHDQFIARVWRQGNKHSRVFVHYILAANTVDELIYVALSEKHQTQHRLFAALKALREKRRRKHA